MIKAGEHSVCPAAALHLSVIIQEALGLKHSAVWFYTVYFPLQETTVWTHCNESLPETKTRLDQTSCFPSVREESAKERHVFIKDLNKNVFITSIIEKTSRFSVEFRSLKHHGAVFQKKILVFSQSVNIWIICPHMAALQQHYNWFKAMKVQIHRNLEIIYVRCL